MSDIKEAISKAWDEQHTEAPATEAKAPAAPGGEPVAAPEDIDAPHDWAHEDREAFRAWQPDVRKAFMDRYTNFTKTAEEKYAEQVKAAQEYAPIRDIITQRQQLLQQRGIRPDQWMSNLAQLDDYATRDPAGFARWYVQNTGLDPRQLFGQQLGQAQSRRCRQRGVEALAQLLTHKQSGKHEKTRLHLYHCLSLAQVISSYKICV
jgi:hypothetical protein